MPAPLFDTRRGLGYTCPSGVTPKPERAQRRAQAYMATEEAAPPAASRVHGAHAHAGRPQGAERTTPEGSPPSRSLRATLRDSSPHDGAGYQPRAASTPPARLSSIARTRRIASAPPAGHARNAQLPCAHALRIHRQQACRAVVGYPQPRAPQDAGSCQGAALPRRLGRTAHRKTEHGGRTIRRVAGCNRVARAEAAPAGTDRRFRDRRGSWS